MPPWLFYLRTAILTTGLGPNQHQQCMPVLPAAADAPTQVSSTLPSCCLQMIRLCKLPPVCERSHCTTRRCHRLKLLASNTCREGTAMSKDVQITLPACGSLLSHSRCIQSSRRPCTRLSAHAACVSQVSRFFGLQPSVRAMRVPVSAAGTPRIRSCPARRTRLQTSQRVVIRHDPRRRRGVRCPGPLSRLSRTGRGGTHAHTDAAATSSSYYLCNRARTTLRVKAQRPGGERAAPGSSKSRTAVGKAYKTILIRARKADLEGPPAYVAGCD